MAVALRDVTVGSNSAPATTSVLSRPSGTQTGDLLVAMILLAEDVVPTDTGGWRPIYALGETPGNDSGTLGWWRIATGGDPSTWTFTHASLRSVFSLSAWSGHDPDRPIDAFDTATATNANATTPALVARRDGVAVCVASTATNLGSFTLPGSLTSLFAYTATAGISAIAGYKSVNAGGVSGESFGNPGSTLDWLAHAFIINVDYSPVLLPDSSAFSAAVLALSPAGYWRLADGYGLTADDAAGSNDGTYAGMSTLNYAPPIFPGLPASLQLGSPSLDLTVGTRCGGTGSGYVSLPSVNWWSSTPDVYTIMCCIRIFSIAQRSTIFGASGTSGKPQLEIEADGTLNMIVEGAFRWDAPSPLAANTSYFIVFTRNGSGSTFHVYVNGSEVTDASPSTTSQTSGAFVGLIGARTTTTQPWSGLISDVALFTTALSSSDAAALYALLTGTTFSGENRFQVPAIIG